MPNLRHLAAGLLSVALLSMGSATAWADEAITLDFVRHGEAGDNTVINTLVPGPSLTELGQQQAQALAEALKGTGIDEIYASTMIRSQETAEPLAHALGMWPLDPDHILPGLNEIDAGIFEGIPVNVGDVPLGGALYLLAPALWTLGLYFVPELGSSDFDGMAFEDRVNDAIQTIYDGSVADNTGQITDAVFSHEGTIAIWALMNANNPDFQLVLNQLLTTGELIPYTGTVVIQGDPTDGWTLVSWDGQPVPPADLPTELFVDLRDFITAPQMAAYNVFESLLTSDPTTIENAVTASVNEIGTATLNFPISVIRDLIDALQADIPNSVANLGDGLNLDTLLGDLSTDLANLVPAITTETTGLLSGELGTMVGEAVSAF